MNKAFTLLEFIIGLFILAIVACCIGYNVFGGHKSQAEILENQLYQILNFAKLQAIANNTTITVCPLDQADNCSRHWDKPISVFTDPEKKHRLDENNTLLKVYNLSQKLKGQLTYHAFASNNYMSFISLGLVGQQNGTFVYCEKKGADKILFGLSISKTGRLRILDDHDPYFSGKGFC